MGQVRFVHCPLGAEEKMRKFLLISNRDYNGVPIPQCEIMVEDAEVFTKFIRSEGPWPVQFFDRGTISPVYHTTPPFYRRADTRCGNCIARDEPNHMCKKYKTPYDSQMVCNNWEGERGY